MPGRAGSSRPGPLRPGGREVEGRARPLRCPGRLVGPAHRAARQGVAEVTASRRDRSRRQFQHVHAWRTPTFCYHPSPSVACGGRRGVAQLVARLLWVQDVVGSNPAAPTKTTLRLDDVFRTRLRGGEEPLGASRGEPSRGIGYHPVELLRRPWPALRTRGGIVIGTLSFVSSLQSPNVAPPPAPNSSPTVSRSYDRPR
jgi:hypothetical protein